MIHVVVTVAVLAFYFLAMLAVALCVRDLGR